MPRNTLADLNLHLFEQLERLNDDELNGEELEKEISRSKAITGIASNIISNASLCLEATKLRMEYGKDDRIPQMLLGDSK
jgi:hypothetical protein